MSFLVNFHVCFPCSNNDNVATLASKHLENLTAAGEDREAVWFLKDISARRGNNPGPKGGLSLWGIVGNYTDVARFVETLKPFWMDLLAGVEGGPLPTHHVLVLYENEPLGPPYNRASVVEIGWDHWWSPMRKLVVVQHEKLPFSWWGIEPEQDRA